MSKLTLVGDNNQTAAREYSGNQGPLCEFEMQDSIERSIMNLKHLQQDLLDLSSQMKSFINSLPPTTHEGTLVAVVQSKIYKY